MEPRYKTLLSIYEIVKNDPQPHTYLCNQREIIVRQMLGWDTIQHHLETLAEEKMIEIKQVGNVAVCITEAGISKSKSLIHLPKITFE